MHTGPAGQACQASGSFIKACQGPQETRRPSHLIKLDAWSSRQVPQVLQDVHLHALNVLQGGGQHTHTQTRTTTAMLDCCSVWRKASPCFSPCISQFSLRVTQADDSNAGEWYA